MMIMKKIKSWRMRFHQLSWQKNQIFTGKMFKASKWPKRVSKRLWFYQSDSRNYSMKLANPGGVFYSMDLLEQVNLSWQRLVRQSAKVLSSQYPVLISWVNGWENLNVLLSNSSKWLGKKSQVSSLSMRWTPCAAVGPKVRMILRGELKLNFSFKCRASEQTWTAFLFLAPRMCLGSWITLSDVDSKSVSISRFPMQTPVPVSLRIEQVKPRTAWLNKIGYNLVSIPRATQRLMSPSLSMKHWWCQLESANKVKVSSKLKTVAGCHVPHPTQQVNPWH